MRVLLVNDQPPGAGSGVEVHIGRLAEALEGAGHTVDLFAGEVVHRGVAKVLDVWDPAARRVLRARAAAFDAEIVHFHNVLRELSVSVLGAPARAARILSVHDYRILRAHEGPEAEGRRRPSLWAKTLKARLDRFVARRQLDALVTVSDDLARRLRSVGFEAVSTVPNFSEPWPDGHARELGHDVAYLGRLSPEKGLEVLVRAFAAVAPDHPGAMLRVAGDGSERPALETLADELAPGRIVFDGLLDERGIRELLRESRIVCAPSTRVTEGAPLAVIEAMHAGRPVVGTESPAFRELLGSDERGLVVPWGSVGALETALDRLLRDDALATRLGEAARRHAINRHAPEKAVVAFEAVYTAALERREARLKG